eukprot:m.28654 g.28654  ORF g.28654 m.28654 type:complete len:103 (-) comp15952_c0_seq1:220-528(-)
MSGKKGKQPVDMRDVLDVFPYTSEYVLLGSPTEPISTMTMIISFFAMFFKMKYMAWLSLLLALYGFANRKTQGSQSNGVSAIVLAACAIGSCTVAIQQQSSS